VISPQSKSWIDDVLYATREAESPTSYIYWSSICAISAVLRNKVYIDRQYHKIYPNLYVLLVGTSGLRKGFPVAISKGFVERVGNTRVITGRNSIQGIIQKLSVTQTTPDGRAPITHSSAYINSGEFSTSLVRDPDALTILTDLYDGHYNEEWTNTLKSGVEALKGVNLTLLGGINPTHFNDIITVKELQGGFIGRCIVVLEKKRARKNSLLRPLKNKFEPEKLGEYLKQLVDLEGPFTLTEEAIDTFDAWYDKFEPETMEDKTGTVQRVHDQILKVAMCLAVSKKPVLLINKEDIEEAMDACLGSSVTVGKVTAGSGVSADSSQMRLVMQELLAAPKYKIGRTAILRNHYGDFSAPQLDTIINTLEEAKAITRYIEDKETWYQLTDAAVTSFERIIKKENVISFPAVVPNDVEEEIK